MEMNDKVRTIRVHVSCSAKRMFLSEEEMNAGEGEGDLFSSLLLFLLSLLGFVHSRVASESSYLKESNRK